MNPANLRRGAVAAFAWISLPGFAVAVDHEAGVPLVTLRK